METAHERWEREVQQAWDAASAAFQMRRYGDSGHPSAHVEYGPFAPSEAELGLLGPVDGASILEIGCGGGQNAVALARQGAQVTAVDISERQLDHARRLAAEERVHIRFLHSSARQLAPIPAATMDILLSISTFQYIDDLSGCLAECSRVLCPNGRLLFSVDHPILATFFDDEDLEQTVYPSRSYFDNQPLCWLFPETGTSMRACHHTIDQWVQHVTHAGFHLQRILEPPAPADILEYHYPEDSALAPLRHLPHTLIVVATKPG